MPGPELPADLPHHLGRLPALSPACRDGANEAGEQFPFNGLPPVAPGRPDGRSRQLCRAPGEFFVPPVELGLQRDRIVDILSLEEKKFNQTLDTGLSLLNNLLEDLQRRGHSAIPGEEAFKLYDTHGFPLELTRPPEISQFGTGLWPGCPSGSS